MIKHTNGSGKQWFTEVEPTDILAEDLFQVVEDTYEDYQVAFHCNLGSITVLDRLTGFGWRDAETGYRSPTEDF